MGREEMNDACDVMVEAITNAAAERAAKIVMKRIDERLLDLRNEESAADPVQDTREQMLRIELDAACATIESLRKREAELVKNHDADVEQMKADCEHLREALTRQKRWSNECQEMASETIKAIFLLTPVEIDGGQRKAWPLSIELIAKLRKLQQMARG